MENAAKNLMISLLSNGVVCPVMINALCEKISLELGFNKEDFVNELSKTI